MKYLLVSDIHGCKPALEKVLSFFETNACDRLLILGDVLNYGPRNGLPEGLDAMGIVELLNPYSDKILAVRGNCDSEVDQMLLEFPMMGDYAVVETDEHVRLFLTHGHLFNEERLPAGRYDVIAHGHTHFQGIKRLDNGTILCNTGSITFPKGGNQPTFATLEGHCLSIRNLEGEVLSQIAI